MEKEYYGGGETLNQWLEKRDKERKKKEEYAKRVMALKRGFRDVPLSKLNIGDLLRIMDLYNRTAPLWEDDIKRLEDLLLMVTKKRRKK
jgi:hypothetical protein